MFRDYEKPGHNAFLFNCQLIVAGIYVHIPFCRKKCFYCDFYKTTDIGKKPIFIEALLKEIDLQANYLKDDPVETIYFGGGTPSVISAKEAGFILKKLYQNFTISHSAEITIESNPDDLQADYLKRIHEIGFNRLSIGIQSFSDGDLKLMNRRHTSLQAVQSVEYAGQAGFSDISIDLIFGLPGLTNDQWIKNIRTATSLPVNHISAYHLTFHEGTVFDKWLRNGTLSEITEEESIEQFEILMGIMATTDFEQYEISNFARNGAYSKHNCNYWLGKNYLGLGPSAHSYNGNSRQWNIANLEFYVSSIHSGKPAFESEILSETDKLNDYLITRLRTKWGISTEYIRSVFGEVFCDKIIQTAGIYLDRGSLKRVGDEIFLTTEGVMISDQIMLSLLVG